MKAPFVYFGGKRRVASVVWERLGDVRVYCEPFFGSGAVLLGRPGWSPLASRIETVNDIDGMLCNVWRAILHDPDATAHAADWPVNEVDLSARHAWLVEQRDYMLDKLLGDPDWYDPKIAGWWLWGSSCWIGSGWCSGVGPWQRVEVEPGEWRLVKGNSGHGINRQIVHLGDLGRGVNRQLVHLGDSVRGVNRKLVHLGAAGDAGDGECGLLAWLRALSARLARVCVCCGDWSRVVAPSAMPMAAIPGVRGIFLDPPYSAEANRKMHCYTADSGTVAHDVRAWCIAHGDLPDYRIALCGYAGEGHEELEALGWSVFAWRAPGGMSVDKARGSGGNNERERIWFSPSCLGPAQRTLF